MTDDESHEVYPLIPCGAVLHPPSIGPPVPLTTQNMAALITRRIRPRRLRGAPLRASLRTRSVRRRAPPCPSLASRSSVPRGRAQSVPRSPRQQQSWQPRRLHSALAPPLMTVHRLRRIAGLRRGLPPKPRRPLFHLPLRPETTMAGGMIFTRGRASSIYRRPRGARRGLVLRRLCPSRASSALITSTESEAWAFRTVPGCPMR